MNDLKCSVSLNSIEECTSCHCLFVRGVDSQRICLRCVREHKKLKAKESEDKRIEQINEEFFNDPENCWYYILQYINVYILVVFNNSRNEKHFIRWYKMRTREEKEQLVREFNNTSRLERKHVEIYEIHKSGELFPKNPYYGINWGACGTVDEVETSAFISFLNFTLEYVRSLNKDWIDGGE